jgi:hypothetical protein
MSTIMNVIKAKETVKTVVGTLALTGIGVIATTVVKDHRRLNKIEKLDSELHTELEKYFSWIDDKNKKIQEKQNEEGA